MFNCEFLPLAQCALWAQHAPSNGCFLSTHSDGTVQLDSSCYHIWNQIVNQVRTKLPDTFLPTKTCAGYKLPDAAQYITTAKKIKATFSLPSPLPFDSACNFGFFLLSRCMIFWRVALSATFWVQRASFSGLTVFTLLVLEWALTTELHLVSNWRNTLLIHHEHHDQTNLKKTSFQSRIP